MERTRGRKPRRWGLLLLDALLLGALVWALVRLVATLTDYRRAAEKYEQIADAAVQTVVPAPAGTPEPGADATQPPCEVPIRVDFAVLRAENPDAVAWLYCADTPINYPVVQCNDNSYYLTHAFDRSEDAGGTLFFDSRNSLSPPDRNLLLYGHRMKDDSMFGSIVGYTEQVYREAHPVLYLITETQSYRVEVFSCRTVSADSLHYFETTFADDAAYGQYLSRAIGQSYWPAPFGIDYGYATLTLVTCSTYAHDDNPRILVHGRLIPVA